LAYKDRTHEIRTCHLAVPPLSVTYPKAAEMPQTTSAIPQCILCRRHPNFAPARLGFISSGSEVAMFQICSDCVRGRDSDAELEPLVLNAIRRETVVAPAEDNPPAPSETAWATRAAKEWVRPATAQQEQAPA
jgi:hypothetical protein